jgi:hypothetical protein
MCWFGVGVRNRDVDFDVLEVLERADVAAAILAHFGFTVSVGVPWLPDVSDKHDTCDRFGRSHNMSAVDRRRKCMLQVHQ